MILFAALLAATTATSGAAAPSPLACWTREADRLAYDPANAAGLRRLTKYEAIRMLWSMAGDSAACAGNRSTDAVMNVAYRHVRKLVVTRHLYRD